MMTDLDETMRPLEAPRREGSSHVSDRLVGARSSCRPGIVRTFAAWTALSALRSGAPIKSRADVYPLLRRVDFDAVLSGNRSIDATEFDAWHATATASLCAWDERLCVGWAVKLLNVYLKTAAYVGGLGRPGLTSALHPPIDGGLWSGLERRFRGRHTLLAQTHVVRRIKDIRDYQTYRSVIDGCRIAAAELNCDLIEVEQLWEGADRPVA